MTGEYRNTVDEKGRLMIPPKVRSWLEVSPVLMLTKSMDKSLWLFRKEEFDALDLAVNGDPMSMFNTEARNLDFMVIAPAREVELDKTGRLSIPQVLRDYAGISQKTECVIMCNRNRIEIMTSEEHERMLESFRNTVSQAGDSLSKRRM